MNTKYLRLEKEREQRERESVVVGAEQLVFVFLGSQYLLDSRMASLAVRVASQLAQTHSVVLKSLRRSVFFIVFFNLMFAVNHYSYIPSHSRKPIIINFFGTADANPKPIMIICDILIALLQLFRVLVMKSSFNSIPKPVAQHSPGNDTSSPTSPSPIYSPPSLNLNQLPILLNPPPSRSKLVPHRSFNSLLHGVRTGSSSSIYSFSSSSSFRDTDFEPEYEYPPLFRGPCEKISAIYRKMPMYPFRSSTNVNNLSNRNGGGETSSGNDDFVLLNNQFEVDPMTVFHGIPVIFVEVPDLHLSVLGFWGSFGASNIANISAAGVASATNFNKK